MISREFDGSRPEVDPTKVDVDSHFLLQTSRKFRRSKIANKVLLKRYKLEMSLQFSIEDIINALVSLTYLSSKKEMEENDPPAMNKDEREDDSHIEVLVWFRKLPQFFLNQQLDHGYKRRIRRHFLTRRLYGSSTEGDSGPPSELIHFVLGNTLLLTVFLHLKSNLMPDAYTLSQFQILHNHHLHMRVMLSLLKVGGTCSPKDTSVTTLTQISLNALLLLLFAHTSLCFSFC